MSILLDMEISNLYKSYLLLSNKGTRPPSISCFTCVSVPLAKDPKETAASRLRSNGAEFSPNSCIKRVTTP